MKLANVIVGVVSLVVVFSICSCKKYLDKKPDDDLTTPSSIEDLQGLLDFNAEINSFPYPAELLSDDNYLSVADWNSASNQIESAITPKNLYRWQNDDNTLLYWEKTYRNILTTNIALDELPKMEYDPQSPASYNNVKGSALFLRSFYFYHLAQMYAKSYEASTAASDRGIVLRLTSDINEPSVRASVKETYDQIIRDLTTSVYLLPVNPIAKTRPGRAAAYGALARIYLSMKKYDYAGKYADSCLQLYDSLMNYNTLNAAANIPFSKFNKEIIFASKTPTVSIILGTRSKIDSNLYKSYVDEDIRKQIFFKPSTTGGVQFKGDYEGVGIPGVINSSFFSFTGIVTDEMYLIKSECYARNNNLSVAMSVLNKLLETRYKTGQFIPIISSNINNAISIILRERRKELVHRGARWSDIKRLSNDEAFKIIPERTIDEGIVTMDKNNFPYLMSLPGIVISLTGIPQNP